MVQAFNDPVLRASESEFTFSKECYTPLEDKVAASTFAVASWLSPSILLALSSVLLVVASPLPPAASPVPLEHCMPASSSQRQEVLGQGLPASS